jgi:hypothetical protein
MTKRSRHENEQRRQETARLREMEAAWMAKVPPTVAKEFAAGVEAARARGPLPPPPNMAPGTRPNPPRPGREPKLVDTRERGPRR